MLDLQNNERGVAEKLRVSDSENDGVVADQLLYRIVSRSVIAPLIAVHSSRLAYAKEAYTGGASLTTEKWLYTGIAVWLSS